MRKIAVFGVVFVAVALAVCLASCSSPSAVIYFSVNGEIVHSQVVTETSGLDDFTPSLADGTFLGWFADPACTVPFSFHKYILSGTFEDITVYALVSHDNTESNPPEIWDDSCEHDLQHLAAKSSTCSERGNLECWYCSLCEQYFADETCETYISPFLDRLGHETTFVPAKAATCTEDGTHEHWHCSRCGLDFEDEDCTVELTNAVISNSGHVLVYHPEEPSTCTSSGHLEYWTCSVCKDSFSSRDALEAVPLESLQKELLPHSFSVSEISQTPSATKSGSALLVCSCGETALLTLPALSGADYAVCSVPSTCTEHGSDTYTLLGAYSVQIVQEKALSPHSRGEVTDYRAPSCTESGSTGFVLCTQCGTVLSPSEPIPANGHDWAKTIAHPHAPPKDTSCPCAPPAAKPNGNLCPLLTTRSPLSPKLRPPASKRALKAITAVLPVPDSSPLTKPLAPNKTLFSLFHPTPSTQREHAPYAATANCLTLCLSQTPPAASPLWALKTAIPIHTKNWSSPRPTTIFT